MYNPETIKITDISLASALLSLRCQLDTVCPFTKYQSDKGTTLTFFFVPTEETKKLISIWEDTDLDKEHPIALMRIFNSNRIAIAKSCKEAVALIEVRKGGKTLLMTDNCTEEQKNKLLSRL